MKDIRIKLIIYFMQNQSIWYCCMIGSRMRQDGLIGQQSNAQCIGGSQYMDMA